MSNSHIPTPRRRAHGLGGHGRPRGFVNTPGAVSTSTATLIKRHGIDWVMDLFGLGRMAVCSVAAGLTVQAQTLRAAEDGLTRANEAERACDGIER